METLGFLVDQLITVDTKLYMAQEDLYKIRRMTLEEFKAVYGTEAGLEELWLVFKKACDLNVQRAHVTDAIDSYMVRVVKSVQDGTVDLSSLVQLKHKSY